MQRPDAPRWPELFFVGIGSSSSLAWHYEGQRMPGLLSFIIPQRVALRVDCNGDLPLAE